MNRLGPHKRWSHKFLHKEVACRTGIHANLDPERLALHLQSLAEDEAKVSGYAIGQQGSELKSCLFALKYVALRRMRLSEHDVYATMSPAMAQFHSAAWHWVLQRLMALGRNMALEDKSAITGSSIRDLAETLAMAYSIGWVEAADRIGAWTLQLLPLGMCWTADDWDPRWEKTREPFARFMLRLYADSTQTPMPELPPHPYEAPPYDALLACWRDPDPLALVEPLLAACDWHTQECMYSRSDRRSKNVDFINDCLMGWPVEVHTIYRLRERLGLALPGALDHPLMQTPFGPYRPPVPIPCDERLHRLIQRAFAEVPGLRELVEPALSLGALGKATA